MSDRLKVQRKKPASSDFINPSLVAPTRGFNSQPETVSSQNIPLPQSHDISRISLRPQAKLTVSQPGDFYEQEADKVAQQVMSMGEPALSQKSIQRQTIPQEEEELLQMKSSENLAIQQKEMPQEEEEILTKPSLQGATDGSFQAEGNIETRLNSSKSGGSPLADDVRGFMEPRFDNDFSRVRVHTGSEAVQMNRELGAHAFAHGSDIYFGAGKSPGNNELTAHELTHVVQQTETNPINTHEIQTRREHQNIQPISQAVIQRDDQTDKSLNPKEGTLLLLEKNRPSVESARVNALVRLGKITKLQSDGNRAIGSLKGQLLKVSERYDQAYKRFATVIAAAQQEARDQQEWVDLVVGIAIGVAVGLCFEAVGAAALVETLSGGAATGLGKWAIKASGEAVGEGGEAVAGKKTEGLTEVAGKNLQPDGLKPEVLKMEIWKSLSKLYESVAKIGSDSWDQALLMGSAEYAIGEIKAQRGGGADMTPDEDVDLVLAVLSADKGCKGLDNALDQASEKMAALEGSIANMPNYDVTQMEKDIWILWMSRLEKDSNIIDIDAIEDHLASLGIVDFGWYTTDAEENEAIEKAKQQAAEVGKSLTLVKVY
ncbi:DUF4157 domain-containing protein [Nostoc sp. XA010]|uniref:eCIS core domain-containing protein n=1 Tax=Nostoc sp. XA010 TaxID=2780407 RepID=UPI001E6118ED|nr:DUF4157 domain-containing protein [Nostoc sp. XA010]MCC5659038.1 DUF4157 domain-containing protein [Nostoc sp. XA010]